MLPLLRKIRLCIVVVAVTRSFPTPGCEMPGLRRGVVEIFALLGFYAFVGSISTFGATCFQSSRVSVGPKVCPEMSVSN
jgi:hypothetical protein